MQDQTRQLENTEEIIEEQRHWIPNALRALRHRDYALYWFGIVISMTGSWMQTVGQGWLVWELTHNKAILGWVAMAGTFPSLAFSLFAGVVADRFIKRKVVIITQTLAMLQAFILAFLTLTGHIEVWHIITLSIFGGIAGAFDMPARHSMIIELVGKDDFLNATALGSSAFNGARFVGPAIAGAVLAAYGSGICFLVNAISYVAVIISLLIMRPAYRTESVQNGNSVLMQIWEGVLYIGKTRLLRDLMIMTAIATIFATQYSVLMPAFASETLHRGPQGYGALLSAAGVGALIAALSVAALGHRFRPGMLILTGSFLVPVGLIVFALSPGHEFSIGPLNVTNYHLALACLVFVGFGGMLFMAVSNSVVQSHAPDQLRGRVVAFRALIIAGVAPVIGAGQVSAIAQKIGIQPAILMGALVCLVSSIYFLIRSRHILTSR